MNQTVKKVRYGGIRGRTRIVQDTLETPLGTAVKQENLEITQFLLDKGADVNKAEKWETTPLHFACGISRGKSLKMVELLLKYKANINSKNDRGENPLFTAIKKENLELVKLLIEKGAQINIGDHKGWTPLHKACEYGKLDIVRLLIEKGAHIQAKTKKQETPLDIAHRFARQPVEEYLQTHSQPIPD